MKKILILSFIAFLSFQIAFPQIITSSTPAKLQVYAMKMDGSQVVMTSEQFTVLYDQLKMAGELELSTFYTDDNTLRNLVDSASFTTITISGAIPEGKFAFQDALNERFVVEAEMHFGDRQSKIILNYEVSNRKTSIANTFEITCTGSISLRDDLGIVRNTGLDDRISFLFFQNVQGKTY